MVREEMVLDDDIGDTTLEVTMIDSIVHSDLKGVAVELGELGLDSVLDEGLIRDIPIIGALVAIGSATLTIRERIFVKKILLFLVNLDETTAEERQTQVARLAKNPKERKKVGQTLILLLDRLDDMAKPALMARAFQALLYGKIDFAEFKALARAIDNIIPELIATFESEYKLNNLYEILEPSDDMSHFLQCGLLSMTFAKIDTTARCGDGSTMETPAGYFNLNGLGKLFYEVILVTEEYRGFEGRP